MEQLMRDRMQDLLKFTLQSHVNQTLEFDLDLSKHFCSSLLMDDPDDAISLNATANTDSFEGIPQYPLFKPLASGLYQSIISSSTRKEDQWNDLVVEKGSGLLNVLKDILYEFHVEEPFCSLLKDGTKTVEGRCGGGKFSRVGPGALVLVNKSVVLEVKEVHQYASFAEMLEAETLSKVLPGVKTVQEGVEIYRKFYTEEKEMSNGVLAFCVSKFSPQPYLCLASTLSGLSYGGVQSLLGLAHTVGTLSDALPPPRSALLASFTAPYRPNVKGSVLTHGARALAKHAERSSNKYWGTNSGSDSTKNKLAMDIINHLIAACCWLNVHIVPPHGAVFEIRVADGYGARWSKDGTRFIGFLEPYMEDGHSRGWKH